MRHGPDDIYPLCGVRSLLKDECAKTGGVRAWGRLHEISAGHISRVINGHQLPGQKVLMALDLRASTVYVPTRWATPDQQADAP